MILNCCTVVVAPDAIVTFVKPPELSGVIELVVLEPAMRTLTVLQKNVGLLRRINVNEYET
jgi:hypothetical protein